MEDIAPVLLNEIRDSFKQKISENKRISELFDAIRNGTASYPDAEEYAFEVGTMLAEAFEEHLSSAVLPDGRMFYNIAERVIRPLLEEDHEMIAAAAAEVQTALNKRAGLSIKAQTAPLDEDRIEGLIHKVSNAELFDDVAWVLSAPVVNFSQSVVDETLRRNVEFQGKSGLRPKIIRKAERKCCEWCSRLAGEYEYPDVPNEVYQRHERCRCVVNYDPGDGRRRNVHTKQWTDPEENAKVEARKIVGLRVNKTTIRTVSKHARERIAERGVTMDGILDAIQNPLKVKPIKYDELGRPSFEVIGRKATVTINPNSGCLTTAHLTHSKTVQKLLQQEEM